MARPALEPIQVSGTVSISATTTSARVALDGAGGDHVEITNDGAATVFVLLGDSSVTATVPNGATAGSYPVIAGQSKVIRRKTVSGTRETHIAAITASGTATVYATTGDGA